MAICNRVAAGVLRSRLGLFLTPASMRLLLSVQGTPRRVPHHGYAQKPASEKIGKQTVKGKGKGGAKEVLKGPEVCKDPVMLTTHAMGVNIYKTGTDPELKPDSEYPEWLFASDLGPPKKLEDLDPDSHEYYKLLRKQHMWRHNRLHKGKKL